MQPTHAQVHYFSADAKPVLEVQTASGHIQRFAFEKCGSGRQNHEALWLAHPFTGPGPYWKLQVRCSDGSLDAPADGSFFSTPLHTLWVQDRQIFSYRPGPVISPSRVVKIPEFEGSLPARPLYVYLPRGYDEQTDRAYPLLFMHDGQNCFEAFVEDSYSGSWRADAVADSLIGQGRMQECIIVGVSNGEDERIAEYLPPYVTHHPPAPSILRKAKNKGTRLRSTPIVGRADQTAAYYRYEVAPYIRKQYRALSGRAYTATCGSSMGGLFSMYLAWERTEFARHHAALSPSFWITKTPRGTLEAVERLRTGQPRDIRLWLDSGTRDGAGQGDDGQRDTAAARDALLENGYQLGPNFQYFLAKGATHSEESWAARLDRVFEFLFPIEGGNW